MDDTVDSHFRVSPCPAGELWTLRTGHGPRGLEQRTHPRTHQNASTLVLWSPLTVPSLLLPHLTPLLAAEIHHSGVSSTPGSAWASLNPAHVHTARELCPQPGLGY